MSDKSYNPLDIIFLDVHGEWLRNYYVDYVGYNPKEVHDWMVQTKHEYPDIQWMGPFSTGLYRHKQIMFVYPIEILNWDNYWQDPWDYIDIKIVNQTQPIFHLYNPNANNSSQETYDSIPWSNLESVLSDSITIAGQESSGRYGFTLKDQNNYRLRCFCFNLVCRSDVEGEFVVDVSIDGKIYKFGASFHDENEAIKINLANKGLEIPDIVSRSFYRSDPYEEKPDWVLLNNKYKELLMNYLDVLDNKGSYKSLKNSLDWFGFEDKVKLKEIWKYETPDGTKMFEADLHNYVEDQVKEWMFNCAKTTHVSLIAPAKTIDNSKVSEKPILKNVDFEYNPTSTSAEYMVAKWTAEEMRMKMVLLGNFLETYFFPIHLDLFRSVLEDVEAFTDTYIQSSNQSTIQEDCFSDAGDFKVEWTSEQLVEGEISTGLHSSITIDLDEVHVVAGLPRPEPYGQAFENSIPKETSDNYIGLPYIPIVACHDLDEDNTDLSGNLTLNDIQKSFSRQVFNGIGALARAHLTFPEKIKSGQCDTNIHGDFMEVRFSESNRRDQFSIQFLFQHPGQFVMLWKFEGESGRNYTKKIDVTVRNNLRPDVDIQIMTTPYEVYKKGATRFILPNPFLPDTPVNLSADSETGAGYMWARTKESNYEVVKDEDETGNPIYRVDLKGDWGYTQYIPLRPYQDSTSIPENAPFQTPVYTVKFTGPECEERMDAFIDKFLNKQSVPNPKYREDLAYQEENKPESERTPENIQMDFYYRKGIDTRYLEDGSPNKDYNPQWCWIQYIHPVRGMVLETPTNNDNSCKYQEWYRKDVFIPEFMNLSTPGPVVPNYYPIVCIPKFKIYKKDESGDYVVHSVPYSYHADEAHMDYAWEFYSWNRHQNISELSKNIQDPFIAWNYNQPLPPGYYTITFRYNFGDGVQEIVKPTPFKLVNI